MQRSILGYLAGIFVLVAFPLVAAAQPIPIGGEFRVNTTTAQDQSYPQAAMDADGDMVVVWADGDVNLAGLDGSSRGIVGQRYDAAGNPVGTEFIVNSDTLGSQDEPAVAMDDDGNFVVVWTDTASFGGDGDGTSAGIAGQLFDSSGNPVGGQFQVNEVTTGQQLRADVTMGDDGGFVVAWGTFDPPSGGNVGLFARRFDASANPIGGEFQVNTDTTGRQYRSEIGIADSGEFVIAWRSTTDYGAEDYDIAARRFLSNGAPVGNQFQVNEPNPKSQRNVSLAMKGSGDFVVVWQSTSLDGSSVDVRGRRFDSTASPVGTEFQANTYTFLVQRNPSVAMDDQGNFAVAWASLGQDGSGHGVFGQQFHSSGTPIGGEFQVNTYTTNDQGYGFRGPDVVMDANGNFTVTWEDDGGFSSQGQDGSGKGVYAQRYDGNLPDTSLVGHWPLDEGSGTTAADTSFNGLDGTLEGGAGWTPGQQSSGADFDGSSGLIRVADSGSSSPIDVTDALTIALWVRPDEVGGSTQVLVSKDNSYELEFGKLGGALWDLRLDNQTVATADTPVEEDVWQHLAATWDGSTVCFYYNGLVDGCTAFAGTLVPNDRDLGFGARPSAPVDGGPVFHFEGALDEIYVYNRALSDVEIADLVLAELTDIAPPVRSNLAPAASLPAGSTSATLSLDTDEAADCRYSTSAGTGFDAGTPFTTTGGTSHSASVSVVDGGIYTYHFRCRDTLGNTNGSDATVNFGVGNVDLCSGLAADWRFDEGSGCSVADTTGANNAVLGPNCPANAPTWVAGRTGSNSALSYDGNDDSVILSSPSGLSGIGQVSIAAWIKHSPAGYWRSIVDRRQAGDDGYDLYIEPGSRLFMRVNNVTLTGNSVVADGTWHHVAGVYDGAEIRLYVDGELDGTQAAAIGSLNLPSPLYIGRHWQNTQNAFAGLIDEVSIHDRALSAVEMVDLVNVGIPACAP